MKLSPSFRKLSFTTHVTLSVGWLGSVIAYLALAITALNSPSPQLVRSMLLSMELIGWLVIVPLALGALISGLFQSLGTEWGLFKHYWIVTKLMLTLVATVVLVMHMPLVSSVANISASMMQLGADPDRLRMQLVVHAAGGLLVLLTTTILSIYKPWGRTPYGRRKQQERRMGMQSSPRIASATGSSTEESRPTAAGRSKRLYLIIAIIVLAAVIAFHLAGGGFPRH